MHPEISVTLDTVRYQCSAACIIAMLFFNAVMKVGFLQFPVLIVCSVELSRNTGAVTPQQQENHLKNARHLREEEDLTLRNVCITQDLTPSQREEQKELRRRRKTMLEELQEKGITDTTVIIRKGQLHKVKKEIRNGGRPRPSRGTKTETCTL